MIVDKKYCMSSFLMFRKVIDQNKTFSNGLVPQHFTENENRHKIKTSKDMDNVIRAIFDEKVDSKTGIMLSSGIDSAILAKYMPKGAKAYTLKCISDNSIDETLKAKEFAEICGLDHQVIDVYWEDYLKFSPKLMKKKASPIHSIEPQIYKASLKAKEDGLDKLVFGESADAVFGGLSGLLSRDWLFNDFVNRFSYVMPNNVLNEHKLILEPFNKHRLGEFINVHNFVNDVFYSESVASYLNACSLGKIEFVAPYVDMKLDKQLDLERVRSGDSKYLVRELFKKLYPDNKVGEKTPMPRPMATWLASWKGPTRKEFKKLDIDRFTGDQKWLLFVLEWFLDLLDEGYI